MLSSLVKKFNQDGEIYLRIKVRPGAASSKVRQILQDEDGEIIKVDIAAPATGGKANLELAKYLGEKFSVNKNCVKIISGAGDRLKLVKIMKM